ncbi:Uncharacterised protein [uncultured archaeon]|nr:Uncharacterised protein [uncultured archaeon]
MFEKKRVSLGNSRRAQIWIETVIYTLIALALIGLVLAFAKPKIDSVRDRMLIEQTIDSMNKINDQIAEVQLAPGNRRVLSVKINQGEINVDSTNNSISWALNSVYKYSEIDRPVKLGSIYILTRGNGPYNVSVSSNYGFNLTLDGAKSNYAFESAPTPYTVTVTSKNVGGLLNVDLSFK